MATKKRAVKKVRGVFEKVPGSGIWWIEVYNGKVRRREKVGRRGDAIMLYQKRKAELLKGKKLEKGRYRDVPFSELAKDAEVWAEERGHKDLRTLKGRLKTLVDEFGAREAEGIEPLQIDHWLSEHENWTAATKNRYRSAMSLVYKLGVKHKKVKSNPARSVSARKEDNAVVRYLLDDEEQRLRAAVIRRCPHHLAAFVVGLHTGMRLSEQFTLEWSQVDLKARKIHLTQTKNGSSRVVSVNKVCLAALEGLEGDRTGRVFAVRPRKWFESCLTDARISGFRWHDLRHTFCSRLAMAGVDIRTIAQLAGHKTLAMAMRYSHLSPEHNLAAVDLIC
jgi:integrase